MLPFFSFPSFALSLLGVTWIFHVVTREVYICGACLGYVQLASKELSSGLNKYTQLFVVVCAHDLPSFTLFISELSHLKHFTMLINVTRDDNRNINYMTSRQTGRHKGTCRLNFYFCSRLQVCISCCTRRNKHHTFVSQVPQVPLQTLIYGPTEILCFAVCIQHGLSSFHLYLYNLQYFILSRTLTDRLPLVYASSSCWQLKPMLIPVLFVPSIWTSPSAIYVQLIGYTAVDQNVVNN